MPAFSAAIREAGNTARAHASPAAPMRLPPAAIGAQCPHGLGERRVVVRGDEQPGSTPSSWPRSAGAPAQGRRGRSRAVCRIRRAGRSSRARGCESRVQTSSDAIGRG